MARIAMCIALIAMTANAAASPAPIIHVARTPVVTSAHVRALRVSLASHPLPSGITLDVSVVRMSATARGTTLSIAAEVRGAISGSDGRVRAISTVRVVVTGPAAQRSLLEKDLLDEAARRLTAMLRSGAAQDTAMD